MRVDFLRGCSALAVLSLVACGSYTLPGEIAGGPVVSGASSLPETKSCQQLFSQRVQPRLEFCRNCHVPGGVADVPDGKLFMLSPDKTQDFSNLEASWEALGRNDGGLSRILKMASGTDSRSHTGGTPWPAGSQAYTDVSAQLLGFVDPAACNLAGVSGIQQEFPLLGSKHAKHVWASYCEDKADDAVLPTDPRHLIQPGVNAGRAVYYNAWWQDCHVNLPEDQQRARTCGEYRARRDRGLDFFLNQLPQGSTSAEDFDNAWKKWGLTERPENFEEMYTLRYGLNHAPFRNPYPLPGEDPNATDGGSGQLPLGMRQLKDADGHWTGTIGTAACFQCHGGQIGDPAAGETEQITLGNLGLGNNNYDVVQSGMDNGPFAGSLFSTLLPPVDTNTLFNIGIRQRGQNNAVGAFELLVTILDMDSLGVNPNVLKNEVGATGIQDTAHPLAHTQDTPAWWNFGSRPRKFFDAGVSNDSTRIIMAAGPGDEDLVTMDGAAYRNRIKDYDLDLGTFFLSLTSPQYPGAIDTALAERGAILFHTKDLWGQAGNAEHPRPLGGNGSCASCHGAYSPRYVHDPAYLEDPSLEGVAGHISPVDMIGTDRARSDMLTPTLRERWDTTYWGFTDGMPGWVAPEDKNPLEEIADDMLLADMRPQGVCGWEKEVIGYQAPPLYGVWATAPYFHNGSVPTVEQVLDSSQRSTIWRRKLQTIGPVTGFDQRLSTAYDFGALGWQSDVLSCSDMPGSVLFNCNPVDDQGPSLPQLAQNYLDGLVSWAGLATIPDPAPGAADKRLIYDTRILGNDNGGHVFTDVLTAEERRALLEYLKTL